MSKNGLTVIVPRQKLYDQLRNDIRNGELKRKLPSIAEFTQKYGVSHTTVKKVLDRLKEQRFIYGMQGKGVYVNDVAINSPAFNKNVVFYLHMDTYRSPFFLRAFSRLRQLLEEQQSIVHLVNSPKQLEGIASITDVMVSVSANKEELKAIEKNLEIRKIIFFNTFCKDRCCINTDNFVGGYMAVEYLYKNGHRKIGLISRDLKIKDCYFDHRYRGCLKFAAEHPDMELVNSEMKVNILVPDEQSAQNAAVKLFKDAPNITAIFAFTDILALGIVSYCHDNGISIPADISLIGFDNRDFSPVLSPPLTTIQEDTEELVRHTIIQLGKVVSGNAAMETINIKPFFVERNSVRPI